MSHALELLGVVMRAEPGSDADDVSFRGIAGVLVLLSLSFCSTLKICSTKHYNVHVLSIINPKRTFVAKVSSTLSWCPSKYLKTEQHVRCRNSSELLTCALPYFSRESASRRRGARSTCARFSRCRGCLGNRGSSAHTRRRPSVNSFLACSLPAAAVYDVFI